MRRHDCQSSDSDCDEKFVARVIHAWGNRARFIKLADDISQTVEIAGVREVELQIENVARQVWDGTPTLDLIGSSRRGTNILKEHGEQSDMDYSLSTGLGWVTDEEWRDFYNRLREQFASCHVERGSKAIRIHKLIEIDWKSCPQKATSHLIGSHFLR
ncbi:unnamed protein product [Prorocentrum cordatum]|uniref:Uncharacterized protein n=1 Tax=Prorocentrum cordatum TaxID=2364126 RepID=A0ABN9U2G9_9DINO|nr:unnamed protein product [Polarella glacialis]